MKRRAFVAVLAVAALSVAALTRPLVAKPDTLVQKQANDASNHVVIITLDGFGGWALDDPHLPLPTLRRLAAQGAVAKGMRPVNPTVTWPNHTSIVTGVTPAKHGVLFNGTLIRSPGVAPRVEPRIEKQHMVRVGTLYDAAHERGMTTAQVDWVAVYNAPTITWEFRERPEPGGGGAIAREMVKAGTISREDVDTFPSQHVLWRDDVWTKAAVHILRHHRPNLLLLHLLNLDSTQHRYGPRTPAAMNTMALLDAHVATIVRALEDTGLAANTTIFVLSDHGFKQVKRQILPNAALLKAGLLTVTEGKVAQTQAYTVTEGGSAILYVTAPDEGGDILARARQALVGVEGIDNVIEPDAYARYGLPQPSASEQMGALFLTAKDGYSFAAAAGEHVVIDATEGNLGTHGYVATDPELRALFIASGRGIKPGVTLDTIDIVDVAPTAARLLNVALKNVDGKVLTEILK